MCDTKTFEERVASVWLQSPFTVQRTSMLLLGLNTQVQQSAAQNKPRPQRAEKSQLYHSPCLSQCQGQSFVSSIRKKSHFQNIVRLWTYFWNIVVVNWPTVCKAVKMCSVLNIYSNRVQQNNYCNFDPNTTKTVTDNFTAHSILLTCWSRVRVRVFFLDMFFLLSAMKMTNFQI